MDRPALTVRLGQSIGFLTLGSSLFDVLTSLKAESKQFPKLDVSYSSGQPLTTPIIVTLPENGLRLRFDGPDQRLRLIEILEFGKNKFLLNGQEISPSNASKDSSGLLFPKVSRLFHDSYPGEFLPAINGSEYGTYVLSFSGAALSFPLKQSTYNRKWTDHATMLTSAGTAVTSIAIFASSSWSSARHGLFLTTSKAQNVPRTRDGGSDEVDYVRVLGAGKLVVMRQSSPPCLITLNETTAQDLITELGPPDAVFKRPEKSNESSRKPLRLDRRRSSAIRNSYGSTPSSYSSTNTDTYDADFEEDDGIDGPDVVHGEDQYYCYYHHGFDILLSSPAEALSMPPYATNQADDTIDQRPAVGNSHITATRIVLHGNVPGSYAFNRHRRCRWNLEDTVKPGNYDLDHINSEAKFSDIHDILIRTFEDICSEKDMRNGMVIVRDCDGDSLSNSALLINGDGEEFEEEDKWDRTREQWLKNTRLYKVPGLMFEVMPNGAVSALTVY